MFGDSRNCLETVEIVWKLVEIVWKLVEIVWKLVEIAENGRNC